MKSFSKFLLRMQYLGVNKQRALMSNIEYGIIKDVKKILDNTIELK